MRAFPNKRAVGPELSESIKRLAVYWETIDKATQEYFEQLYNVMPETVSEVLAGLALPRDEVHLTLGSWIEGAAEAAAALDFSALQIRLARVWVEPTNPQPGQAFRVHWTGEALTDFPAREDKVTIQNIDEESVVEQIVEQAATPMGPVRASARFRGLPRPNEYAVIVVVNSGIGLADRLSEHGLRTESSATFVIGDDKSRGSFFERRWGREDLVKFNKAAEGIHHISQTPYFYGGAGVELIDAADLLASMRRLSLNYDGGGEADLSGDNRCKAELVRISSLLSERTDDLRLLAERVARLVEPDRFPPPVEGEIPDDLNLRRWAELLHELRSKKGTEDPADLAEALIRFVDAFLGTQPPTPGRLSDQAQVRLEQHRLDRQKLELIERERAIGKEVQTQIDTLQKQAGEIGMAISSLTGTDSDDNAIASLTQAFDTLMGIVVTVQGIAQKENLQTVNSQAATVYQDGADAANSLSIYSEGSDSDNLSTLKIVVEEMIQSTTTLSGAITKDLAGDAQPKP